MKKSFILFLCFITGVAHASIKGDPIHFDVNDEFLSAFEICAPYSPEELRPEDMLKNDMMEEYNSIEIKGVQKGKCVFDLIMQMSSKRMYSKMVKRCKIPLGEQIPLLEAIKDISYDKGSRYLKETSKIMNHCKAVSDVSKRNSSRPLDKGYMRFND